MKSISISNSAVKALGYLGYRLQPPARYTCPPAILHSQARSVSTQDKRKSLLRKIYTPFAGLVKGSPEYNELAKSGTVWDNHFRYSDSERYGYLDAQEIHAAELSHIDDLRRDRPSNLDRLLAAYTLQSVQIEDNHLSHEDNLVIQSHLKPFLASYDNLSRLSAAEVSTLPYPDLTSLIPTAPPHEIAELRNHLIARYWIAARHSNQYSRPTLSELDIRSLSVIVNRDTGAEDLYRLSWGRRLKLGDYRAVPIQVKSTPLRVFPYPREVPALMERFCQWLSEEDKKETHQHPVVMACQAVIYFVSIHPFPDGNGRVSRLIMQDLLMRAGYVPPVIELEGREDYIGLIREASEGNAGRWVGRVVRAVEEGLLGLKR